MFNSVPIDVVKDPNPIKIVDPTLQPANQERKSSHANVSIVHFEMKCSKPLQLVMPRIHMLPI
jgi:hypothetical protein